MGTPGMVVLRDNGKRGLRTSGLVAVRDHLGDCPPCCGRCAGAYITSFSGYGAASHYDLTPYQGPGIAPTHQKDMRWGLFVLPPYANFHNLWLAPGTGYLRHDCPDCYPPTHWVDTSNGFVDFNTGTLLALPSVLNVSPNVLTIMLAVGCPNAGKTAVDFPIIGSRPWF